MIAFSNATTQKLASSEFEGCQDSTLQVACCHVQKATFDENVDNAAAPNLATGVDSIFGLKAGRCDP